MDTFVTLSETKNSQSKDRHTLKILKQYHPKPNFCWSTSIMNLVNSQYMTFAEAGMYGKVQNETAENLTRLLGCEFSIFKDLNSENSVG